MVARRLRRYEKSSEISYAEGVFATLELLTARPDDVEAVLVSSRGEPNAGVKKIREICAARGVGLTVDDRAMERLSPRGSHLAVGVFRKYSTEISTEDDHVVLVEPADMGNLGTIFRTMLGFGVRDLAVVRPAADAFDPRVIRASMGALFRASFSYFDSFGDYARRFPRKVYSFMIDGTTRVDDLRFQAPCALVFGNESSGLGETFRALGESVRIGQTEAVDSLSLPVAVAVALYERARRGVGAPGGP
ncbi:MAG: TrmH family RNA methyltransferase [Candidatus Bipolaricaulota bacterium]